MGKHSKTSNVKKWVKSSLLLLGTATGFIASNTATASAAPADTLPKIAECESGGNSTIVNPHSTASGLYQFLDSTWAGFGGYARAKDAPVSVQTAKALLTPLSAWNASRSCWDRPGAASATIKITPPKTIKPHVVSPKITKAPVQSVPVQPVDSSAHAVGAGTYHVVVKGDSLWRIAETVTGSGANWPHLYSINRTTVGSNPNLIFPGEKLLVA